MAPEASPAVRQATLALVLLAAAATEIAAADTRPVAASLGLALLLALVTAGLGWLVPKPRDGHRAPRWVLLVLLLAAGAPFVIEPLRRSWLGAGWALEMRMVFGLRNLALVLAVFAAWRVCLVLACVASLFLMLFAVSITDHPAVLSLLGLYGAAGSAWLMLAHWANLRRFFLTSRTAVALEVQPGRERLPWLALLLIVALVGSTVGILAAGPQRATRVLAEWLPTSGGTGAYDPFARGGVNDGDDEVSGENPHSTGMTQTDTFLDSPLPTLYDMFNDVFGEPFKPKERERAISLDAQTKVLEMKQRPKENLRPNREFPTVRQPPRQPGAGKDRAARALFEVQGRTPLHVRAMAFDQFDGKSWHEAPVRERICVLDKDPKSCWMVLRQLQPPPYLIGPEAHQFKITEPNGALLPTPPHLTRFRIPRVDQPSFFAWSQERILCLAERKVPAGIVLETECRVVEPRRLDLLVFASSNALARPEHTALPANLNPEIAALARRWTHDLARGWPQVEAVLQRLRADYSLDITAGAAEECADPLGHFLLEARRGPDYQFATAAAVLLRILGYPTRLVTGFYVAPEKYDPITRHTPVVAQDLHCWAEVLLPSGDWLVVEAAPGYAVLGPSPSLSERLGAVLLWAWERALVLSLGTLLAAALWFWRRDVLDAAAGLLWRWFPGATWRQQVRRTTWLLEWRGRWAGRPRPLAQTVPAWLAATLGEEMASWKAMVEWAAYGQDLQPPWRDGEVLATCRAVVEGWTWRALASRAP